MSVEARREIGDLLVEQLNVIDPAARAHLVDAMTPGSDTWIRYMTASKISAVVGLSTYESPFSLWHRMAGTVPASEDTDITRRGHYLEPAIRAWFADQHPDWHVVTTGTWVHNVRDWQAASPDALVYDDEGSPSALAEFKTAHEDDQWGEPGSDDIPVGYRCQVQWQMDTLGVEVCHVVVLTRHLEFVEYVVHYDPAEAELLRQAGSDFMTSLACDEAPSIDGHGETYRTLRHLHPEIDGSDVELSEELAREYCEARAALYVAELDERVAKNHLAAAMGNARRARYRHQTIAHRQAKGDGKPYIVAGRKLPNFSEKAA